MSEPMRIGDATLYTGDVLSVLAGLPEEGVHCVVISPPYWGLRDYGIPPTVWDGEPGCAHEWGEQGKKGGGAHTHGPGSQQNGQGQIAAHEAISGASTGAFCRRCGAWLGSHGLEPTPELYVRHEVQIFRAVHRVLRKDGTLWLNLGSSYAGSGKGPSNSLNKNNPHSHEAALAMRGMNRLEDTPTEWMPVPSGFKPKDMIPIPWMVAMALQVDGWYLRSDIIWAKPNPMPESCTDRPTKSHEYLFLLAKSGTAQFWTHRGMNGVRKKPLPDYRWHDKLLDIELSEEPENWRREMMPNMMGEAVADEDGEERIPKKVRRYRRFNLWRAHDYFYDAEAIKEDVTGGTHSKGPHYHPMAKTVEMGQGIKNNESFAAATWEKVSSRNRRTVWTIATEPYPEAHFATFPRKLVQPCILAGCPEHACPKCGAPWVREVKTQRVPRGDAFGKKDIGGFDHGQEGTSYMQVVSTTTIGEHPTCSCGLPAIGGTVMDIFGGSGTTAEVALEYGRKAILIELKPEYVELQKRRLAPVAGRPMLDFAGGAS